MLTRTGLQKAHHLIDAEHHRQLLRFARVAVRRPPPGCVHHSGCGSQYAAEAYRTMLAANGLVGSMGRCGNPYVNAKAESFMKTLKVEAAYPMAYESFEDAAAHLPHLQLLVTTHISLRL